ncbi:hypothetical protein VP193E371_P0044 [Vibrio phage 193E37-1]|nr:hypothetical protein VP193E371_P0044 [Vibrio phage 193E37-1]
MNILEKFKMYLDKRKELHIQKVWNSKTDNQIIESYKDNQLWVCNLKFLKMTDDFSMWESLNYRYEKLIKPQMDKRNLWGKV